MDPIFAFALVIIAALVIFALSVVSVVAITHGQRDVAIQAIKNIARIPKDLLGWKSPDKKQLEEKSGDE